MWMKSIREQGRKKKGIVMDSNQYTYIICVTQYI